MKGNHVEEVKKAMLVTVGDDGKEQIVPLEIQEVSLETEEYTQDL